MYSSPYSEENNAQAVAEDLADADFPELREVCLESGG
jgi:hypothetical protein